jgi:hypothetical protein
VKPLTEAQKDAPGNQQDNSISPGALHLKQAKPLGKLLKDYIRNSVQISKLDVFKDLRVKDSMIMLMSLANN